jgi:hypothetical protein
MGTNGTGYVVAAIRGVPMVLQNQNTPRATCPSAKCAMRNPVTSPQSSQGAMPMPSPPHSSAATIDASKARSAEKNTHTSMSHGCGRDPTRPYGGLHFNTGKRRARRSTCSPRQLAEASPRMIIAGLSLPAAGAHVMWRVRTKRWSCRGTH